MHLKLSNAREAKLGIQHVKGEKKPGLRSTRVWLTLGPAQFTAEAKCGKGDNFCRRTGRRLAANRLLEQMRDSPSLTKEDRRIVFRAVCPEFGR